MGVSHKWGPDYDDIYEGLANIKAGDTLAGAGNLLFCSRSPLVLRSLRLVGEIGLFPLKYMFNVC